MKKIILTTVALASSLTFFGQQWRSSDDYTSLQIGPESNDRILADNLANNYGGGIFFRVHDESLTHKYRDVMTMTENGNVGIGTIKPSSLLELYGGGNLLIKGMNDDAGDLIFQDNSSNQLGRIWTNASGSSGLYLSSGDNTIDLAITDSGKIGIGTSNPTEKLEVNGYLKVNSGTHSTIRLGQQNNDAIIVDNSESSYYGGGMFFRVHDDSLNSKYRDVMMLTESGNVGIGTTSPKNKLSVNGTIWAKEITVSLTDAADWVFEDDYNLRSLEEVENFIKANKHLPEVPSAQEFRKNDLKVSEMTNLLLQKIEELTLYTIEINKRMKLVEEENRELKKIITSSK